ncbi:MAG: BrxE family protein [Anaerolineales bacterium]|nr:BrxE family protein [Anaerolineales bacterium]
MFIPTESAEGMVNLVHDLLQLRILVLTLGEASHAGWWKSRFLTPTGLSYLSRLYPRSSFAAAVRSTGEAARLVHDASIGVGQVFHLFRLPLDEERRLETALQEIGGDLEAELAPLLTRRQALLERLGRISSGQPNKALAGPQEVGSLRDWQAGRLVGQVAALYGLAFRNDNRIYPYIRANGKLT